MARSSGRLLMVSVLVILAVACGAEDGGRESAVNTISPVATTRTTFPVSRLGPVRAAASDIASSGFQPSGRVVLKLFVNGGWELPERPGRAITVEDTGRVVRVTDLTVFSAADDFTTLVISRKGIHRILEEVLAVAPTAPLDNGDYPSPTDVSARLEIYGNSVLNVDRVGVTEGYESKQIDGRQRFERLMDLLDDLTWLGEDILEPESAWIPDSLGILAGPVSPRSGLPAGAPFAEWPLDRSIEELAHRTAVNAYDEPRLAICLRGADVEPVFALLTGVNHAYLRVDDGERWELNVMQNYPGYRLATDPCR